MPPVNWNAIQSLARAKPGASPPLLGASNANPDVARQIETLLQTEQASPGCLFMAKNALNGGELSPMLSARFDQPRWQTGCRLLRNLVPLPQGGITKRPGFRHARSQTGAAGRARFIPFVFGQHEQRMLELLGGDSGSVLNVFDPDGNVICLNALSLPYKMGDLRDLTFAQSADVVYLAHQNYAPAKLMRYADTDWRYAKIDWLPETPAPQWAELSAHGPEPANEAKQAHYYRVTAVNAETGEESLPNRIGGYMAYPLSQAYFMKIRIVPMEGISEYRVYKKKGGVFGFIGRITEGDSFEDHNISPDTEDTPPNARDPFSEQGVGYPSLVFLHQQRLGFAASSGRPMTIWLSQSGNYESMAASIPPKDDDAIEVTMGAARVNRILWCAADRGALAVGTQGGEWVLEGAEGEAITPGNLVFKAQTRHGSEWGLMPLLTGSGLIYCQAGGRVARQFSYSFSSDRYESPELTLLARHMLDGKNRQIRDWAWQGEPYGIAWMVLGDGTLAALTYLPEQEITAWHRHDTKGVIEDIASIGASDGYDRIWLHVIRDGTRSIEIMRPFRTESDVCDSSDYADGAANHPIECECVPLLPETSLQNGSTWMRVRKLNAIKAEVVSSRPFQARIGKGKNLPVPVRGSGFASRGQWALPIAGGWQEDTDLVLTFPGNGPATVLGLLFTLELAELSGSQK